MTNAIGANMVSKHTDNFRVCLLCQLSNQFLIEIVESKGDYYYIEKCPRSRCNHVDEIRLMGPREAKRYLNTPTDDPSVQ